MLLSLDQINALQIASVIAEDYIDVSFDGDDVTVTIEVDRTPEGEWVARLNNAYTRYLRPDGSVYRYDEDTAENVPADFLPLFGSYESLGKTRWYAF